MVNTLLERARELAELVLDPELPVVSIGDLGMIRDVDIVDATVIVSLTPTYPACPAIDVIGERIESTLRDAGMPDVRVHVKLSPPWTSEWITAAGRLKLTEAGVAPPRSLAQRAGPIPLTLSVRRGVTCPRCASDDTTESARYGATACTALQRCNACGEPFEYVKEI